MSFCFFFLSFNRFGFEIANNTIDSLENLTPKQYCPKYGCYDVHELADTENGSTPQDANIRGISVGAARYVLFIFAFNSKANSDVCF